MHEITEILKFEIRKNPMSSNWQNIHAEIVAHPLSGVLAAIDMHREAAKQRIADDNELMSKLDELRSKFADILGADGVEQEADADLMPFKGGWTAPMSTEEKILHALEEASDGITFDELHKSVPHMTRPALYHLVRGSKDSLVNSGKVTFDRNVRPGIIRLNPDFAPSNALDPYIQELIDADPKFNANSPLVQKFAEAIRVYTEQHIWPNNGGKRIKANHTWKGVRAHGIVGAIEKMVERRPTKGFNAMITLQRIDLTAEAIVMEFREHFSHDVFEKARARYNEWNGVHDPVA